MSRSDKSFYDYFRENKKVLLPIFICLIPLVLILLIPSGDRKEEISEEERLCEMLSSISGVGECEIMISYTDDGEVDGVAVLCEGAESPSVRQSVKELFSSLYGIGRSRISILKIRK
jgi:hypothetical protein